MDNDELKEFIKRSIREALHELLLRPEDERRTDFPYEQFLGQFEHRLRRDTDEFGSQVERLSMLVSRFESWSSSGCKYDANEISAVKQLLASIDAKLP
jgi:hypothetical protein